MIDPNIRSSLRRGAHAIGACALLFLASACDLAYPEVVIENRLGEKIQAKDISWGGCLWSGVLRYGETTSIDRCLPGDDRVRFKKFDAGSYEAGKSQDDDHVPLWYNYQTATLKRADYGDFSTFVLTVDDWEQDFTVPGPFGH